MNRPYEYVLFLSHDYYQLPIKYYDTLEDIATTFNYNKDYLCHKFRKNSIIEINDEYSIERYRKEKRIINFRRRLI